MIPLRRLLREAARCVLAGPSVGSMGRRLAFAPLRLWLTNPRRALLFVAVRPYTMLPYPRLAKLAELAEECEKDGIAGAFVECGSYRGGSAAVIISAAVHRRVHIFDSFQGCPEPSEFDVSFSGRKGQPGEACANRTHLQRILVRLGLSADVHAGWFSETVGKVAKRIGPIALLHIDCDWHTSVKTCFLHLWDSVSPGGFIIVDDFFYWQGANKAVVEFYREKAIPLCVVRTDASGGWIRKAR